MDNRMILAGGAGCFVGAFIFYRLSNWWARLRLRLRLRKGVKAEARVEKILKRYGYKVRGVQRPTPMTMIIDGRKVHYEVRPDAIATKKRRWYLVEVKTGNIAVNPLFRETRRQLLEYYHSLPVDGVLLVNADRERVQLIRFVGRNLKSQSVAWRLVMVFVVGVILASWVGYVLDAKL